MIEMAAPARRVLTAPPAAHLGGAQHAFDPASEARGCLLEDPVSLHNGDEDMIEGAGWHSIRENGT
jgi:hypothetical protein